MQALHRRTFGAHRLHAIDEANQHGIGLLEGVARLLRHRMREVFCRRRAFVQLQRPRLVGPVSIDGDNGEADGDHEDGRESDDPKGLRFGHERASESSRLRRTQRPLRRAGQRTIVFHAITRAHFC